MLAFSFIRSLNNITSAEKAKYLRFQQHELFAPLLLLPLSNTSFRFVFVFGGGDSLIGKLFHGDSVQRDHLYSWIRFSLCFHHGIHFQEILLFFIFLCCYGMEWLLWRRLSLFFSVRRTWKINEVFKVFQIPLDLKLAARTQTRKENLLQIVFKTCRRALFVVEILLHCSHLCHRTMFTWRRKSLGIQETILGVWPC